MSKSIRLAGRNWTAAYERTGQGRPLVYLHGAFGLEWSMPLIETLARTCEVIAPHLPGYGASEGIDAIASFYDLSVWLDEVLDALGLERADLAGHDLGGAAAAEYAALFRCRVDRLALVAPLGLWIADAPMPDIFGLTPGALARVLFADPESAAAAAFNKRVPDPVEQNEIILRRRQALIAAAQLLWPIPDKGLHARLYRIRAATLLAWGRDDALTGTSYADAFAAALPQARTVTLPGGHMLPQETPTELATALTAFFDGR